MTPGTVGEQIDSLEFSKLVRFKRLAGFGVCGCDFPPAFSVLSAYWRGKKRRRRGDPRERAREERPYIVPEYSIATGDH